MDAAPAGMLLDQVQVMSGGMKCEPFCFSIGLRMAVFDCMRVPVLMFVCSRVQISEKREASC